MMPKNFTVVQLQCYLIDKWLVNTIRLRLLYVMIFWFFSLSLYVYVYVYMMSVTLHHYTHTYTQLLSLCVWCTIRYFDKIHISFMSYLMREYGYEIFQFTFMFDIFECVYVKCRWAIHQTTRTSMPNASADKIARTWLVSSSSYYFDISI